MQLIQPKLAHEFACLADKCPSTCCKEWNIVWRESEIRDLASCGKEEITARISDGFAKNGSYYSIKHGENGHCPFLLDSGLCSIHKNAGEQYLSYVCREYPRIARAIGDIVIKSCKTACYGVMDIISNNKECMTIESTNATDIEAIITPENEISRRRDIFCSYSDILKSDYFAYYNKEEAKRSFSEIFGFELITAEGSGSAAEISLAKAVFLEFVINGFTTAFSDEANRSCLEFCLDAVRLAFSGAVKYSDSNTQFVGTMCDITSFILANTAKITSYIQKK